MTKEDAIIGFNSVQVEKAVDALLQYIEKKNDKTSLLEGNLAISLQLGLKKIPDVKNKIIKINLPHKLVSSETDICLFVKDLDKNERDYEPTQRHYKELLENNGIKYINQIIPLKCLKTEYQPYEAKRNLSTMYDVYLADERIIRLLPSYLGKSFIGRKRYPLQVNLNAKELEHELSRALCSSLCVLTGRGSTCQVKVSTTGLSRKQTITNINTAIDALAKTIPGGSLNIKSLHLKSVDSPALPIYVSFESADAVELPLKAKRPKLEEPEDVDPIEWCKVSVTRGGPIRLMRDVKQKISTTEDDEDIENQTTEHVVMKKVEEKSVKRKNKRKISVSEEISNTTQVKKQKENETVVTSKKTSKQNCPAVELDTNICTPPKSTKKRKVNDMVDSPEIIFTAIDAKETPESAVKRKSRRKQGHASPSSSPTDKKQSIATDSAAPKSAKKMKPTKNETPKSANKTPKPTQKETPKSAPKTPKLMEVEKLTTRTPKSAKKTPKPEKVETPKSAKKTPKPEKVETPKSAKKTPKPERVETPKSAKKTPKPEKVEAVKSAKKTPKSAKLETPKSAKKTPKPEQVESIKSANKTPKSAKKTPKPEKVETPKSKRTPAKLKTPKSAKKTGAK